jgi:hypothetical protein
MGKKKWQLVKNGNSFSVSYRPIFAGELPKSIAPSVIVFDNRKNETTTPIR